MSLVTRAEVPSSPRRGHSEIRASGNYFMSSGNYSAGGGASEELPNGGSISSALIEGMYLYDWKPDWRLYGGANFSYIETDDGTFQRSNSALNEVMLGAQNWYDMGPLDIAAQGDFYYSIYEPDEGADEAVAGDGAMRLRGGAWAIYPMGALKPFGYLGFEYRNGGRSYLLPYSAGVRYRIGKLWIQGEYRGYESIVDDADTENRADRDLFLEQVNAGSYRYYAINPALSEFALEAGMRFGAVRVFGGINITVAGSSSADGWGAMAGISYSPSDAANGVREEDFDIRDERYDESLFNEEKESNDTERFQEPQFREDPNFQESPVTAPPPEEMEKKKVRIAPPGTTPVKPPKPRKSPKQQALEESQDVELQIEMQHVKPKKKKKKPQSKKNLDKLMKETEKMLEGG